MLQLAMALHPKGAQQAHHIVVVFSRRRPSTDDPAEQISVRAIEQTFESVELGAVKLCEARLGE